jgi:hypothetical protein
MTILGVIGFIGSGKGTVGNLLIEKGFHKDSFASPLKDACSNIFGWPRHLLEGDTELSRKWREVPDAFWSEQFQKPFSPRLALQLLGTEAGRNIFHPDIWVVSLLNRAKGRDTVVTDVRFKNEIKHIRNNGGLIIRIKRGKDPEWFNDFVNYNADPTKFPKPNVDIHLSETDWIGCDYDFVIENEGSIDDLAKKIDCILTNIR